MMRYWLLLKSCDPFGCKSETTIDHEATQQLKEEEPKGKWVGFEIYTDRNHLAFKEVGELWENRTNFTDFVSSLNNLPFYKAMGFTMSLCHSGNTISNIIWIDNCTGSQLAASTS